MLVEKKYPLKKAILEKMINLKLEAEEESTMAHELLKFIKSHIEEQNLSKITRSIQLEPTLVIDLSSLNPKYQRNEYVRPAFEKLDEDVELDGE
ncbi:hypothetical protein Tco_0126812 [Tanacetum coccineum]